jgi:hypothetical protein
MWRSVDTDPLDEGRDIEHTFNEPGGPRRRCRRQELVQLARHEEHRRLRFLGQASHELRLPAVKPGSLDFSGTGARAREGE